MDAFIIYIGLGGLVIALLLFSSLILWGILRQRKRNKIFPSKPCVSEFTTDDDDDDDWDEDDWDEDEEDEDGDEDD